MTDRTGVSLRMGFWLGWKIESNWADPLVFLLYAVARPLGSAFILVAMFYAVSGGERGPLLDYLVVGSTVWPVVVAGLSGIGLAVISDREHWHMTRPVYTSPISWRSYLVGRSLANIASVGVGGVVATVLVGWGILGVDFEVSGPGLAVTAGASVLGLVAVLAVGLLAVAYLIAVPGEAWSLPDALSAALFLVCGAIFPVGVLPDILQGVSRVVPFTWWLESLRRCLLGDGARLSFPALSDGEVFALLAVTTGAAAGLAAVVFGWSERRARHLGILDRESGY